MIGVAAEDARPSATVTAPFSQGDTLIAFTDGLIERRGEDIDVGQERLLRASPELNADHSTVTLPRVIRMAGSSRARDDVTALALRKTLG